VGGWARPAQPLCSILVLASFHRKPTFSLGKESHKIFTAHFRINTKFVPDVLGIILNVQSIFKNDFHILAPLSFLNFWPNNYICVHLFGFDFFQKIKHRQYVFRFKKEYSVSFVKLINRKFALRSVT